MDFYWENLISVADELIHTADGSTCEESYYRSAINRAYYGAYKSAAEWLEQNTDFTTPVDNSHGEVIHKLTEYGRDGKKAAAKLRSIRPHRVDADYYLDLRIDGPRAELVLKEAKSICNLVKTLQA